METKQISYSITNWKELSITMAVALICLSLFFVFPTDGIFESLTKSVFFLFLIPVLYIKLVLKRSVREFGLNLQNTRTGFLWGGIMLLVSLLSLYLFSRFTSFQSRYILPESVMGSFWIFLLYEIVLINALIFLQEFFFQGFILNTLASKTRFWSILLSALAYAGILLISKDLNWQKLPLLIMSLTGGWITYQSRSFIYAHCTTLLILLIFDTYIIYTLRAL